VLGLGGFRDGRKNSSSEDTDTSPSTTGDLEWGRTTSSAPSAPRALCRPVPGRVVASDAARQSVARSGDSVHEGEPIDTEPLPSIIIDCSSDELPPSSVRKNDVGFFSSLWGCFVDGLSALRAWSVLGAVRDGPSCWDPLGAAVFSFGFEALLLPPAVGRSAGAFMPCVA
jgi:hypothetical protein